jgi:hypothetical protein
VFSQPRFLHAAAKQREELGDVLLRDRIVAGEHQQERHRQLGDVGRPVVVFAHHLPELVEELRKALHSGEGTLQLGGVMAASG